MATNLTNTTTYAQLPRRTSQINWMEDPGALDRYRNGTSATVHARIVGVGQPMQDVDHSTPDHPLHLVTAPNDTVATVGPDGRTSTGSWLNAFPELLRGTVSAVQSGLDDDGLRPGMSMIGRANFQEGTAMFRVVSSSPDMANIMVSRLAETLNAPRVANLDVTVSADAMDVGANRLPTPAVRVEFQAPPGRIESAMAEFERQLPVAPGAATKSGHAAALRGMPRTQTPEPGVSVEAGGHGKKSAIDHPGVRAEVSRDGIGREPTL